MSTAENLEFEVLIDGRLAKLGDWNEAVAQELASRDGISLNEDHWCVINAMRNYYNKFNVSPVRKLLKRDLLRKTGSDRFNDDYLTELFPGDVLLQGSKLAGVPVPHLDIELERSTYQAKAIPGVAHFVDSFEFKGERFAVTPAGNLMDLHRWSSPVANFIAEKEGIQLTAEHWEVLNFLREFYFTYGVSPMVKIIMKYMAEDIGPDRASKEHLYSLFPKGPARQGTRIAGLPEPQGCIDPDV